MRKTCLTMVAELARRDPRVVFIGSDLTRGLLEAFYEEFPGRFIMEGVSEASIVGMMAGLASCGKIPYLNTIATFITRRCFEQIALDACLHRYPIRLIGSGGGLVYASLGPTHQAIDDIALMRTLPNMTIVAPADANEMRAFMPLTLEWPGPIYIRLAKGNDPIVTPADLPFQIGCGSLRREGKDVLFITTGIMLSHALDAAETLEPHGIAAGVYHLPTVQPLDVEGIQRAISGVRMAIAAEEHFKVGGLGSAVAEVIAEMEQDRPRFRRIGFPHAYPEHYGSQDELMRHLGVHRDALVSAALEMSRTDRKVIV